MSIFAKFTGFYYFFYLILNYYFRLIFSQSLISLTLIEDFLAYFDEKGWDSSEDSLAKLLGEKWGWQHALDYFRMDGSTPVAVRKKMAELFNDSENLRARLFLISTKAGGLGINLCAANRVVIFDASWNPTHVGNFVVLFCCFFFFIPNKKF